MKKMNRSTFVMGMLLIIAGWFNYLSRGEGCLRTGGGSGVCGNTALLVMVYVTLGGLYLIYRSFKK